MQRGETRLEALKRKFDERGQPQISPREELIEILKAVSMEKALEIVSKIQDGNDIDAILHHVRHGSPRPQLNLAPESQFRYALPYTTEIPQQLLNIDNVYIRSLMYESVRYNPSAFAPSSVEQILRTQTAARGEARHLVVYTIPFHASKLIEPILEVVQPSKWTNVSTNDVVMRRILTSYFKSEYHSWPVFHKDYFLSDMQHQKTTYCSALLVNAVLAHAAFCYEGLKDRCAYWDPRTLTYRFLAESRRLWELLTVSGTECHVTTVQAAFILNCVFNLCGLDKIGHIYGFQGAAIAHRLSLFGGNAHIKDRRFRDACNFAAWGVFNLESLLSWNLSRKPAIMNPPKARPPDPLSSPHWYGEIWHLYPTNEKLIATDFPQMFRAKCDFYTIVNDLCHECFGTNPQSFTRKQAQGFGSRLEAWYDEMPTAFHPDKMILPSHFIIQLEYHLTLMMLYRAPIDQCDPDFAAAQKAVKAEENIYTLMRLYYIHHGFQVTDVYLMSPLAKLGMEAVSRITPDCDDKELEANRSTLFLAAKGIYLQSCSCYLARMLYRVLVDRMRPEERHLLHGIVGSDGSEFAMLEQNMRGTQARWMPAVGSILELSEEQELSRLVEQCDLMDEVASS